MNAVDWNDFIVPLFFSFMITFLFWRISYITFSSNLSEISFHKGKSANTIDVIEKYYSNEHITKIELIQSYVDSNGPYREIWWGVHQARTCSHCGTSRYMTNGFTHLKTTSNTYMTHGRITKDGNYDKRFNTDFDTEYSYYYSAVCPHCRHKENFVMNEELQEFPTGPQLVFQDTRGEEMQGLVRQNWRLAFINTLIPASLLYLSSCYVLGTSVFSFKESLQRAYEFITESSSNGQNGMIGDSVLEEGRAGSGNQLDRSSPGVYYVSEDEMEGIPIFKDVRKKSKFSTRIMPMKEVSIVKVENSLGYFESLFDNNYNQIPKGWIEMDRLIPSGSFYTYPYGQDYRVKSSQERVSIFKDYKKKKSFKTKIRAMDKLRVFKIKGNMAYFVDFLLPDYSQIDGWIELSRIEKVN